MKKLILFAAIFVLMYGSPYAQWTSNYTSHSFGDNTYSNAKGLAVSVDNSGNCFVTGYSYVDGNGNDIITIKYDATGDTLWTRTYNGSNNSDDQGFGIATDNTGNVFVTGTASIAGKSYDVVLLKYDSYGTLQWDRTYSGSNGDGEDKGQAIKIDNSANIYVTGYCTNSDGILNIVTIKYNESGDKLWSKKESGPDNMDSKGFGIATDNSGNVNVTGYTTTSAGGSDMIVVQYNNSDGERNWISIYNNTGVNDDDKAYGIAVDASDNIIITGYTNTDVSSYNTNCITRKYNSSGTLLWSNTYNGNANSEDKAYGIVVDNDGSIYITGYATNDGSGADYVTIRYSEEGNEDWIQVYNGTGNGEDKANAIGIVKNHNNSTSIVVTGASWGSNNNHDYATVKYSSPNGSQEQVSRYSMTGNSDDKANSLASSEDGLVYVTGFSELQINGPMQPSFISTMMLKWGEASELITKSNIPAKFTLHQNYPNPFNPTTTIKFDLTKNSNVKLVVYDMMGREVTTLVNQSMNAGSFSITFNSSSIASGVYFYRLTAGDFTDIKKMTLIK